MQFHFESPWIVFEIGEKKSYSFSGRTNVQEYQKKAREGLALPDVKTHCKTFVPKRMKMALE